jgi:hypothetical protein
LKKIAHFDYRWLLSICVIATLFGCASGATPLAGILSGLASEIFGSGTEPKLAAKTNPSFRYLRIEVVGRQPALLVLGYIDADPQGDIEVWYSAKHEVIKTQNGRIVGTMGLEVDWRSVRFLSNPSVWTAVPLQGSVYQRLRDEMPSYRYAIADQVALTPWVGVPPITLSVTLPRQSAHAYRWFRETSVSTTAPALPPAWFAWGMHRGQPTVVYSEQCLSATFCLKLQRWPAQENTL